MLDLYQYQREDVDLIKKQKAGLIGSEMGTGKTLEAIAIDKAWYAEAHKAEPKKHHKTLIVAPLNTFSSWLDKLEQQVPDVDVMVIDRKNRQPFIDAIRFNRADIFLMHYDALRLIVKDLQHVTFNTIIADEVHRISNRKATVTMSLKKLKTVHKLGLSGTASGDKPENLWSILNWLWPSFYKSYWKFRAHYCVEEMVTRGASQYRQITGVKNAAALRRQIDPWYVRHLKREKCCEHHPEGVMNWLPDKTYDIVWVDLSPSQRRVYEQMRKNMVAWVGEHEESPLVASVVVAQLARLSQMTLATPEFDEDGKIKLSLPSSKLDALKEILNDNPEKPFVVFTASRQMAYIVSDELERIGIRTDVLSGATRSDDRLTMVDRFQRGEFRVFVGVIQAAAEGIDGLQHVTDTAIFLDRSWSTLKNMQAEDRLHRGGQKDTVQIIDIMTKGTLDLGRKQRLETKWAWIKEILGDGAQDKIMHSQL